MRTITDFIIRFGIIEFALSIFALINAFTFALYAVDKRKAIKNKWRIRESVMIFFTLALGGVGALLAMLLCKHKIRSGKFKVATAVGLLIALVPLIHIAHALTLDGIVRFTELDFASENWPQELDGYRIAFMTDFHVIADDDMRDIAAELNRRNIDLLLLGGDFSTRNAHYQGTLREIAAVSTADGIFGVEGNHDAHITLFAAMRQHGIMPLDNTGLHLHNGFFLAGVHDKWNRSPDIAAATAGTHAGDFVLLISHNPDVAMVQSTIGVDLILSGHTHGGQITFFGFPIYLLRGSISDYGTRFGRGFADSEDGVPVFTSGSVGVYYSIPRVFARPEVVIFTMRRADG